MFAIEKEGGHKGGINEGAGELYPLDGRVSSAKTYVLSPLHGRWALRSKKPFRLDVAFGLRLISDV
jgi:hypothetical protein